MNRQNLTSKHVNSDNSISFPPLNEHQFTQQLINRLDLFLYLWKHKHIYGRVQFHYVTQIQQELIATSSSQDCVLKY